MRLRRHWISAAAFAAYALAAFLYLGLPVLRHPGRSFVGTGYDPQIFIWSFGWWPHAILHGQNPFFSHAIWAPDGVNLAWATSVPGLALLFAPVTLIAGPVAGYDVAAVLMPALAAWTAFLLCRYLTSAVWPSLVGGYLFGFSPYVLQHDLGGQLNLSSVFLLPLIALVSLRFLNGELGGRGLVARLGPLLALQLLFSTELSLTLALAFGVALGACAVVVPARRSKVGSFVPYLLGSYALAGLLTAPFLYFLFTGFRRSPYFSADIFKADGRDWILPAKLDATLAGITSASEAYIGLPALVLLCFFVWSRRRAPSGRFVIAVLAVCLIAELGAHAAFAGHRLVPMPWGLLQRLPPFNNVLPARFALYASLVIAVTVALWAAARRAGPARWALPALAALAVYPNHHEDFVPTFHVPAFFTSSRYRTCLDAGETILPLPIGQHGAMLWQAEGGYRFNIAGGYIGPYIPPSFFATPGSAFITIGNHLGREQADAVRAFVAAKHVTTVVVDEGENDFFSGALDALATPQAAGGVVLYRFEATPPSCPGP